MSTAQNLKRFSLAIGCVEKIRQQLSQRDSRNITIALIFTICITVTSGVYSRALSLNNPIFINDTKEKIAYTTPIQSPALINQKWRENINQKYSRYLHRFPTEGVVHIKLNKYINSKPIKINIVEINPSANENIVIKPQIAGEKLNSKAQIKTIAQKENAIVAINAGYFKPQSGVPLGALKINNEILTGPILNRVGLGIIQNNGKTSFVMDKITMEIKLKTSSTTIKVDNINQPRMLSTYTLIYTPKYSPVAPKYGKVAAVKNGRIIATSANQLEIPQDGFVISAPAKVIDPILKDKKITYEINLPEKLKDTTHIIGAGPYLVKNGEIYVDTIEEKFGAITGRNPRSAVGFNEKNELIIITIDGREETSVGVTLYELAKIMKSLGCTYAMNLDGGGSSVMYVQGKITNSPAQQGGIGISNALTISEIQPPTQT